MSENINSTFQKFTDSGNVRSLSLILSGEKNPTNNEYVFVLLQCEAAGGEGRGEQGGGRRDKQEPFCLISEDIIRPDKPPPLQGCVERRGAQSTCRVVIMPSR